MRRLYDAGCLLLAALLLVVPVAAQSTPTPNIPLQTPLEFTTTTDPVSLVGAYYNAISRGDYARAFGYWETPPNNQTPAQFAAGFSDTLSARAFVRLPVYIDAGAGNLHAQLPTLLIAEHRDGGTVYYAGCLTAHKTNVPVGNAAEPDPNWYLQEGDLVQYPAPDFTLLDTTCEFTESLVAPTAPPNATTPSGLIASYFTALAQGDTALAAAHWQNPPGDLFEATYGSQTSQAQAIDLYINPEIFSEGAAGSVYATIPALTLLRENANTFIYITGCYTARLVNVPVGNAAEPDPNWHFSAGAFTPALDAADAIGLLTKGCTAQ